MTDSASPSKSAYRPGGSAGHVDSGCIGSVVEGVGVVVEDVGSVLEVVEDAGSVVDVVAVADGSVGSDAGSEQDIKSKAKDAKKM